MDVCPRSPHRAPADAPQAEFELEMYDAIQERYGEKDAEAYAAMTGAQRYEYLVRLRELEEHEVDQRKMLRKQMGGYANTGAVGRPRSTRGDKLKASKERTAAGEREGPSGEASGTRLLCFPVACAVGWSRRLATLLTASDHIV